MDLVKCRFLYVATVVREHGELRFRSQVRRRAVVTFALDTLVNWEAFHRAADPISETLN